MLIVLVHHNFQMRTVNVKIVCQDVLLVKMQLLVKLVMILKVENQMMLKPIVNVRMDMKKSVIQVFVKKNVRVMSSI